MANTIVAHPAFQEFLENFPRKTAEARARVVARHHQTQVPEAAMRVYRFADSLNLNLLPNKNRKNKTGSEHGTSRVGAKTRRRWTDVNPGVEGIPVYDELTTLMLVLRVGGQDRYVLVSYRSHEALDLEGVKSLYGAAECRIAREEELGLFGLRHGIVTPFLEANRDRFDSRLNGTRFGYVFDHGLLDAFDHIGMVMTNASDQKWSIEFRPAELISALQRAGREVNTCSVTVPSAAQAILREVSRAIHTRVLVIGGDGPESASHFMKTFRGLFRRALESIQVPTKSGDAVPVEWAGDASQPTTATLCSGVEAHSMTLMDHLETVALHDMEEILRESRAAAGEVLVTVPGHTRDSTLRPLYEKACQIASEGPNEVKYISIMEATLAHAEAALERLAETRKKGPLRVLVLAGKHILSPAWSSYPQGLEAIRERMTKKGITVEYVYPTAEECEELDASMYLIKSGHNGSGISKLAPVVFDRYGPQVDLILTCSTEFSLVKIPHQRQYRRMNGARAEAGRQKLVWIDGLRSYASEVAAKLLPHGAGALRDLDIEEEDGKEGSPDFFSEKTI